MERILTDGLVGTVQLADRAIRRLGFGAMRISGARNPEGVRDRDEARRLVRTVYDRGVTFFDAANIYGYGQCEEILAEALHPYPPEVLIATKAGFQPGKVAPGATSLPPLGRPEHIVEECEKSLRRLRTDCLELYLVHVPDPAVPYEETVGAFARLQEQGKVAHIGVSNVSLEQLALARSVCEVVCVQNAYGVGDRRAEDVLTECARSGIPFLPHSPILLSGGPADEAVQAVCARHDATPQQVAVAWLLRHSPVMLPIPGTSSVVHAQENLEAAWLELSESDVAVLAAARG